MSFLRRRPGEETAAPADLSGEEQTREPPGEQVVGERSTPVVNRARSLQSRIGSALSLALVSAIGVALLTWYYSHALGGASRAHATAESSAKNRAKTEMALPPLGPINPPAPPSITHAAVESILGPAPDAPSAGALAAWRRADEMRANAPGPMTATTSPGTAAFERRLKGSVFSRQNAVSSSAVVPTEGGPAVGAGNSELGTLLTPSVTKAVEARVLPTRELLLAKGAFIDCTLETAIDSTLPGMTTCITATDTFSADGRIVLLERGTKLVGETRGQVQQGAARVFVLWTEARTPTGVVVPLSSPGTDELGRSGLPGIVDRHFWDRFGAAMLLSVLDGAVQAAAQSTGEGSGAVVVNPSASSTIMAEVLKGTIAIAPTVRKAQGDRLAVLVARDLDFRAVYELKAASATARPVSP